MGKEDEEEKIVQKTQNSAESGSKEGKERDNKHQNYSAPTQTYKFPYWQIPSLQKIKFIVNQIENFFYKKIWKQETGNYQPFFVDLAAFFFGRSISEQSKDPFIFSFFLLLSLTKLPCTRTKREFSTKCCRSTATSATFTPPTPAPYHKPTVPPRPSRIPDCV